MNILLVTGGAGFIGSNFIRYLLRKYDESRIVNLDKLTYAGNLENLRDVEGDPRYFFYRGDICDVDLVEKIVVEHKVDAIVNFAAASHVDRSILEAEEFVQTDVYGTYVLLEVAKRHGMKRFLLVSTDEIYGSIEEGFSRETDPPAPRNPYSASKAGAELLVQAYHITHGVQTSITRGANTIGPFQYPEKRVPLFTTNAIDDLPLPIYGDGRAVRDHLYVEDHCAAIDLVLHKGAHGEAYNIGAGNEVNSIEVAEKILDLLGKPRSLMQFVKDRPAHDRRYAMDCQKIRELGWEPLYDADEALERTVRWYVENQGWWRRVREGQEYREYYKRQYVER
jgi:dTDP-glucose 4,6-dehydratase